MEEIDRRGESLYAAMRSKVGTPENRGRQMVIDVESGDYEIEDDGLAASRRLLERHPGGAFYGVRIGYNAVYSLGGVIQPVTAP